MTQEIKDRISKIQNGQVPNGYKKTEIGIIPNEWKAVPLKELVDYKTEKNRGKQYKITYTNSATEGVVSQEEYFEKTISNDVNIDNYYIVEYGDYVYNPRISIHAPCGPINKSHIKKTGIMSPLYTVFKFKNINNDYYEHYFHSSHWFKYMYKIANFGARSDRMNISNSDFFDMPVPVPPKQQKIADILSVQDKVIELEKKKIEELQNQKKYFLSKMFPGKGSNVPEIRFPKFTEPWEQRKLAELALFNPREELPQEFEYVDLESVVGTEMQAHRTENRATAPLRAQRLAHSGDLFYQTVRPYQKNNYLFEKSDDNYVFSTGYAQMRPLVDGYFLLSLVQSEQFVKVVLDNCTGTSYPAINANDLAEIVVAVPADSKEYHQIGKLFRNLDHLITLHQRKLEEEEKIKKALMQLLLTGIVRIKNDR